MTPTQYLEQKAEIEITVLGASFNNRPGRNRYPGEMRWRRFRCVLVDVAANIIPKIASARYHLSGLWIHKSKLLVTCK